MTDVSAAAARPTGRRRPACRVWFEGDSVPLLVAAGAGATRRLLDVTPPRSWSTLLTVSADHDGIEVAYVRPESVACITQADDLAEMLEARRAARSGL